MRRKHNFLRAISFILLQSFIIQQVSFADVLSPAKQNPFEKPNVDLKIPQSVATIEDTYLSSPKSLIGDQVDSRLRGNDKLIYLIQDAHTNESGQLNLSKSLDILLSSPKPSIGDQVDSRLSATKKADPSFGGRGNDTIKYVFTEAGVSDNSLSFLRPFRPLAERRSLALSYIKKGLLHGVEYLDLTSEHDFTLWGVENPKLYIQSIEDYRAVSKDRERFDLYLKKIDSTINTLKTRILNPSLT